MLVYKCTNSVSGKCYIGKTVRSLEARAYEHLKELRSGKKRGIWQEEYNTYGEPSFTFEVLERCSAESLSSAERSLIIKLNTLEPFGYNKTLTSGYNPSAVSLAEMSKYSLDTLEQAMALALSSSLYTVSEIAAKCDIPEDTVQDLLRCKSFTWLREISPELYAEIARIHNSGCRRDTYLKSQKLLRALELYAFTEYSDQKIAELSGLTVDAVRDLVRGKAYTSIAKFNPELYTLVVEAYRSKNESRKALKSVLDTSTGITHTFKTCAEGARQLNIDHRRLSELLAGKIDRYLTLVRLT